MGILSDGNFVTYRHVKKKEGGKSIRRKHWKGGGGSVSSECTSSGWVVHFPLKAPLLLLAAVVRGRSCGRPWCWPERRDVALAGLCCIRDRRGGWLGHFISDFDLQMLHTSSSSSLTRHKAALSHSLLHKVSSEMLEGEEKEEVC